MADRTQVDLDELERVVAGATAELRRRRAMSENAAWLHRWLGKESDGATGRYDEIGDWFRAETGIDRPGRSVPMECYAAPDEDREKAFREWCAAKQTEARVRAEALSLAAPEVPRG